MFEKILLLMGEETRLMEERKEEDCLERGVESWRREEPGEGEGERVSFGPRARM